MITKKLFFYFIIIISIVLNGCGFSPKYSGYKDINFTLNINNTIGDRDLNNLIKTNLSRYKTKENNQEIINININSKYKKITTAKNTKGEATEYDLQAEVTFGLSKSGITRSVKFEESFKINKIEDTVEENNYIRVVKRDFAKSISDKLISNIQQNK